MISPETKHRLGEFLHAVSENERGVEMTRQVLAETHTFAPMHLFTALDVSGRGVSTSDLIRFLTTMRIYCSSNDAYLIVKQYDSNSDERINYDEFLQVTLPATSPSLRELALSRTGYLSYDVEYAFSKLLDREMQYQRDVELRKSHLQSRYDFNAMDLFRALDVGGRGAVSRDDIRFFMRELGLPIDETGLDAIIRRLDHDADERLSYAEFVEALTPVGRVAPESLPYQPRVGSPVRGSPLRASTAGSPYRESASVTYSPARSTLLSSAYDSPSRSRMSYLAESSRIYQSRSLGPIAETELVNVFKQQIELDREIERSKQKLTLQHDFNLQDAFAMFDPLNKSYIGAYDLERAMANFRVYAGKDEPDLLIRHFTKGLSRMGYAEFGKVFTSREPEYARMLNSRPREGRRVFSFETETKMQDLLRLHLRAESMAESLRQRLSSTHEFSLHRAFNDLDIDRNGYITLNEFESMLRHHGFPATTQDLQLLLERYDKNGDGRVSYGEFVQEVTPQSPRKH